jgi:hypothetical protein
MFQKKGLKNSTHDPEHDSITGSVHTSIMNPVNRSSIDLTNNSIIINPLHQSSILDDFKQNQSMMTINQASVMRNESHTSSVFNTKSVQVEADDERLNSMRKSMSPNINDPVFPVLKHTGGLNHRETEK